MLVTCWSVKGGSGTTVVAATLALLAARTPAGALLADLGGDLPAVLGLPEPSGPGLADWLAAAPDVGGGALHRIEVDAGCGLALLPYGGPPPPGRGADLAVALSADERTVVVDAGLAQGAALDVVAASTVSLLVLRPCYLALRRAAMATLRPSGVVLVTEPYRALRRSDVEAVLGVPVRAQVLIDPAVARAVDAGLLAARLPRSLANGLRRAA
jgi:hypothetical protein